MAVRVSIRPDLVEESLAHHRDSCDELVLSAIDDDDVCERADGGADALHVGGDFDVVAVLVDDDARAGGWRLSCLGGGCGSAGCRGGSLGTVVRGTAGQ